MPRSKSETYDAVVVGARCAGAATAMLLARAGLEVLLVDKSPPGTDTLSTHALMRGGVSSELPRKRESASNTGPRSSGSASPRTDASLARV